MRAASTSTACPTRTGRRVTSARRPRNSSPPSRRTSRRTDCPRDPHRRRRRAAPAALDALGRRGHAGANERILEKEGGVMLDKNPIVATESVAADQLKAFIERIERLEEEKAALAGDIREVYGEAKGNGFDTKVLRKIVGLRKKDFAERQEEEAILELYMQALGMS